MLILLGGWFVVPPILAVSGWGTGETRWPWDWPWQSWCCVVVWTLIVGGYLLVASEHVNDER